MSGRTWTGEHIVDGQLLFRIGRDGSDVVAEWPGLCELRSDRAGDRAELVAREGADERIVAKIRAGLAGALVRHLKGETSLHASAVARAGRAYAFLGPSGAGKSTLAAWMCHRHGWALLADDITRLTAGPDEARVVPTEQDHWLDHQSRQTLGLAPPGEAGDDGEKSSSPTPVVATSSSKLTALIAIAYDGQSTKPSMTRLRGHAAMAVLLPCLVRFVLDEPEMQIAEMNRIELLLSLVPLYEIRAPREFVMIEHVVGMLEDLR